MKNLTFKRVVLLSDSQKSANQFEFQKKYNLITAHQNSCGKTSLVKSLFWALGCDPHDTPDSWKELDCKVLVECEINGTVCKFYRYQNKIKLSIGGQPYEKFANITGDYASKFSELVGFSALLPNRPSKDEEPELETPPPAYYFLPFYIDQKKGWNEPWNGFDRLAQYADWKRTIVKFHTGYLPPRHFEIEQEIYEHKKEERIAENEISHAGPFLLALPAIIPLLYQGQVDRLVLVVSWV